MTTKTKTKTKTKPKPKPKTGATLRGATLLHSGYTLTFEVWQFWRGTQGEIGSLGKIEMPAYQIEILSSGTTVSRLYLRKIWAVFYANQWWEVAESVAHSGSYVLSLASTDPTPPGLPCGTCGRAWA